MNKILNYKLLGLYSSDLYVVLCSKTGRHPVQLILHTRVNVLSTLKHLNLCIKQMK
jgi:hypothetical protein